MWQVKKLEIRKRAIELEGQPRTEVLQLYSDNLLLTNAVEWVDWETDETQLIVCEACGTVGCQVGNWVRLRRAGDWLLLLPAFENLFAGDWRDDEYRPPAYIFQRGIPYIDVADYELLRAPYPAFPTTGKIRELQLRDAIRAFQWDAPARVFAEPPAKLKGQRDRCLGASEGDCETHIKRIEDFATENFNNKSTVRLRLPRETEAVISLYLDTSEFTEYKVYAHDGTAFYLMLDSRFVVCPLT